MVDGGPANVLREVEEGRHADGVVLIEKKIQMVAAEEEKRRISQNHESTHAVRSGSQSSSPAPSVTGTNKNEPKTSVANDHRQSGMLSRKSHSRPLSYATEDEVVIAGDGPPTDTVNRVKTGLQSPRDSKPSRIEKVGRTLCIPCSTRRAEKKEAELGDVQLDARKPGPWVVDHHLRGLVVEIVPSPVEGFQQQLISRVRAMFGKSRQGQRLNDQKKPERTFRVSFAEMQRMHLRKLQAGLANHAVTMYTTKEETQEWEEDLAAYIQAMKDYDYMMECSTRPRDHFLITGERDIDHYVTKMAIRGVLRENNKRELNKPDEEHPLGPWEYDGEPIGGTRNRTLKATSLKDFRDRLFLATIGAALLLGPMWLMVLHNTLYTGLVTTTVCVAVFGLVVVFRLDKPMDVLSATAAYAAVLVVFVGLTTDSS